MQNSTTKEAENQRLLAIHERWQKDLLLTCGPDLKFECEAHEFPLMNFEFKSKNGQNVKIRTMCLATLNRGPESVSVYFTTNDHPNMRHNHGRNDILTQLMAEHKLETHLVGTDFETMCLDTTDICLKLMPLLNEPILFFFTYGTQSQFLLVQEGLNSFSRNLIKHCVS